MITKILKEAILRDVWTDEDPQVYVSTYPTKFTDISQVPIHLYKSMPSIWLGSPGASGELAKQVSTSPRGQNSEGSIVILLDTSIPSHIYPRGFRSDQTGANTDLVRIIIYKPRHSTAMPGAVEAAAFRIIKILDHYVRTQDAVRPLRMSSTSDLTVDPEGPFYCFLEEMCGPGRLTVSDAVIELVFRVEYVRMFL